jgi:hypothetical protein
MTAPDIFTNVHRGIRKALFQACEALGCASDDDAQSARERLREALRFVDHHGENEDLLLLPLLSRAAPNIQRQMQAAHAQVGRALTALQAALDEAPAHALYLKACEFTSLYLAHMREEEVELEGPIRKALTAPELEEFGRQAVARTAPADQRMMLAFMLPAMPRKEAEAFLARLPSALATELRMLLPARGPGRPGMPAA